MRDKGSFVSFCLVALAVLAIGAQSAYAFPTYSRVLMVLPDGTEVKGGNCRLCHGDFRADNYTSNSDGQDWGNLHNLHRFVMFEEDTPVSKCDPCHMGGGPLRYPVFLYQSSSDYLDPIGCMGCHGRYEDMGNDGASLGLGAGLRQHHTNAGVALCADCHDDADPANYTPVGEDVLPPYYFTPDEIFENKPTGPCNHPVDGFFGEENYAGIWEGLDNDGDGVYDVLDPDCSPPFGKITVCHIPPGNPDKAKEISVNAASLAAHLFHGDLPGECRDPFASADMVRGGRMYDRFWAEAGTEPTTDHPLWATRPDMTSNPRTGSTTWRCKECHGWDYRGVDGAYGSGSHRTGFAGIFGTSLTAQEVVDLLADPAGHNYGSQGLTVSDLRDLAKFVVNGQVDTTAMLAADLFTGDPVAGQDWYDNGVGGGPGCADCHGTDGLRSPPTTGTDPFDDFPHVIAADNPWEFQHKVRYGQPGTAMRGIVVFGGTAEQTNDIGAHAQQNLP